MVNKKASQDLKKAAKAPKAKSAKSKTTPTPPPDACKNTVKTEVENKKRKQGTPINWTPLRSRYVSGKIGANGLIEFPSMAAVAAEFGVDRRGLEGKAKKENWVGLRASHQAAAAEAHQQAIFAELRRRAAEESKGYFDASSKARKAVMRRLEKDEEEKRPNYQLEPTDISRLMSGLRASQQVFHISLGLPADGLGSTGASAPLWEPFGKKDQPVLSDRLDGDNEWIEGESIDAES